MNLLIRADSSSQIGLGHIMRDLVLAEQYPNALITFACQDLPGNMIDMIPYPVHILTSNTPEELIDLIRTLHINRVIFDHYGIDALYEKQIKDQTGITIISLDDTYQKHHCDILLNPNIYAQSERYRKLIPPNAIVRCGKEFLLIREEFYEAKRHPETKTDTIFIAMGGTDPDNLSMKILQSLPEGTAVHLVTSTSNPHLNALHHYASQTPAIHLHVNAKNIAQLMAQSTLAVITPSSIAHEVIFMGLPFIAIQSADNQSEFVAYMKREGLNVMERFDSEAFKALLERLR